MQIQRTLRVVPNPYCALDGEGRPAGLVPKEREMVHRFANVHAGYVGGRWELDPEVPPTDYGRGDPRYPSRPVVARFDSGEVSLADTIYYRDRIRCGELIAADAETARTVGVPLVPVDEALVIARQTAALQWRATYQCDPPFVGKE